MKKLLSIICGASFMVAVMFAGSASATLIGLDMSKKPDIFSDTNGTYSYNAGSGLFTATATPYLYTDVGGSVTPIPSGSYQLSFYVDSLGNYAGSMAGNDLEIHADLDGNPGDELVLSGNVYDFGWTTKVVNVSGVDQTWFEFDYVFNITGGSLADDFGGIGLNGGSYSYSEVPVVEYTSWTADHSGENVKSDTVPVPEPATALLLIPGFIGLIGFKKRKSL